MKTHRRTPYGFTLLEVMVAITILAFLSLYTARAIQNAVRSKAKIQGDIDRYSVVRDALKIISRDVRLAFHHQNHDVKLYNEAQEERIKRLEKLVGTGNQASDNPNPDPKPDPNPDSKQPANKAVLAQQLAKLKENYKPRQPRVPTHFVGDESSVNFTTLSHGRSQLDSKESNQAEVGYFLRQCRGRLDKTKSSNCLWRRESTILDDDIEKGGHETVLLEDVQRFELRYLGPGHEEEYTERWRSDAEGETSAGKFPYAVEVTLEVQDKSKEKSKPIIMTSVAPIIFPNNIQPQPEEETTAPGQPAPGSPGTPETPPDSGGGGG